ncbi:hypothetical protein [Dysgonomonas sp. GY617]|uniref:hypothetical protein n=1 Tax=Dysgonomonas sp. GY617 TaxID=2780420 RepID=UPI0018835E40|nr:hypothetical protein [Dysgonomonas sp. GY617]MBF0577400.1 hypothetical protein [Dysgonomonas sp. GY617]
MNIDKTLHKIVLKTGRVITECRCEECKSQCRTPCLGTPDDIIKLIEAGYTDKLRLTVWTVGMRINKIEFPIPMVQAMMTENGCIFFKNGLCELHDLGLKPTEGKLSNHTTKLDNYIFEMSLTWNVAREWIKSDNIDKIISIIFLISILNK